MENKGFILTAIAFVSIAILTATQTIEPGNGFLIALFSAWYLESWGKKESEIFDTTVEINHCDGCENCSCHCDEEEQEEKEEQEVIRTYANHPIMTGEVLPESVEEGQLFIDSNSKICYYRTDGKWEPLDSEDVEAPWIIYDAMPGSSIGSIFPECPDTNHIHFLMISNKVVPYQYTSENIWTPKFSIAY